jgi:GDP-L-fucose synthase
MGRTRNELNLLDRSAVFEYVAAEKPDAIIIAAARVGGINANKNFPVEFLSENLQIQTNLLDAAHYGRVNRLLFLGSSCVYPKYASQPIKEDYLMTGSLEESNEPYAIAKISGLKLVQAYRKEFGYRWISAMPSNVYGSGDNFDLDNSHVLPALIRKFHEAYVNNSETVTLWGSGTARREFLHSDDLANACLFLLENYDEYSPINVGVGVDITISELAAIIKDVSGFKGRISWDLSMPDGTPRKLLDTSKLDALGWKPSISLLDGIKSTYDSFARAN